MTDKAAPARFKLEIKEAEWKPVEEKYTADKWGLYNNASQRVGSKNNVTSYELAKLLSGSEISDIRYETKVSAHAYGKTILSLNDEIKKMDAPKTLNADGTADIIAGSRKYHFDTNAKTCTVTVYKSDAMQSVAESYSIELSQTDELSLINMRRILPTITTVSTRWIMFLRTRRCALPRRARWTKSLRQACSSACREYRITARLMTRLSFWIQTALWSSRIYSAVHISLSRA
jgi:hypothetical protein